MVNYVLAMAILASSLLAVFIKDNVFAAISLAFAASFTAIYYALIGGISAFFLILVVYVGAVVLLVMTTAAMYGGVVRQTRGRVIAAAVLSIALAILISPLATGMIARGQMGSLSQLDFNIAALIIAIATSALISAVEIAKRT